MICQSDTGWNCTFNSSCRNRTKFGSLCHSWKHESICLLTRLLTWLAVSGCRCPVKCDPATKITPATNKISCKWTKKEVILILRLRWKMVSVIKFVTMVTNYVAMEQECIHAGNWGKDLKKQSWPILNDPNLWLVAKNFSIAMTSHTSNAWILSIIRQIHWSIREEPLKDSFFRQLNTAAPSSCYSKQCSPLFNPANSRSPHLRLHWNYKRGDTQ